MYIVLIVKENGEMEKCRCKTVCELLKLFERLDEKEVSTITVERVRRW